MTLAGKIVGILTAAGFQWPGGPANARIVRTRAGHWQRLAGAWSWHLQPVVRDEKHYPSVGSQHPAKQIARGPTVATWNPIFQSIELDPA